MSYLTGTEKPQRSCLGCRAVFDKEHLIRFVRSPEGEIFPDLDKKLPGRGAYTCINSECVRNAVLKKQFNRAFKIECIIKSADELISIIKDRMVLKILGFIGLANKAGKVISGGSMVTDAIKSSNKPGLVLLANDISPAIAEKIKYYASVHSIPCLQALNKDDFGSILGKAPRSSIALRNSRFVAQLFSEIKRYLNFLGEVR